MHRAIRLLSVTVLAAGLGSPLVAEEGPVVGQRAPGFSLPSLSGETVSLADFKGRPVVLHFGAGW